MSDKKRFRLGPAVVNINSMKPEMAEVVINICNSALRDNMTEQEAACEVKLKLKEKYADGLWQVFIGRNFGAFCTFEEGKYIYFYIGQVGFCVFAA